MVYFEKFESLDEFSRALKSRKTYSKYEASHKNGNAKWYGTESYEEADNLMKFGDKDKANIFNAEMRKIKISVGGYTRQSEIYRSRQGFVPDIPSYLAGHPNNMFNVRTNIKKNSKVLTICYNVGCSYAVTTETIIKNATLVARLISTLEKQGYRVNLYVSCCAKNENKNIEICAVSVKVKDSGKPLDTLRLAYPLINPSFFRRHIFAYLERQNKWHLPKNYGYSCESKTAKECLCSNNEIYIDHDNVNEVFDELTGYWNKK